MVIITAAAITYIPEGENIRIIHHGLREVDPPSLVRPVRWTNNLQRMLAVLPSRLLVFVGQFFLD